MFINFYKPTEISDRIKKRDEVQEQKSQKEITRNVIVPKNGQYYEGDEISRINEAFVEKIVYPEDGGILSYMQYYKYPYKGFPLGDVVHLMATFKGFLPILSVFLKKLLKNPFSWITIKSAMGAALPVFIELSHKQLEPYFPEDPKFYCKCVREVYKGFGAMGVPLTQTPKEFKEVRRNPAGDPILRELDTLIKLRNIICFILEFDNAYRHRFQDIMAEIDKNNFEKDYSKELGRLFDLLIDREKKPHMKKKWSDMKKVIIFYLKVAGKEREMIKKIINSLNIEEIKLQEDDWYFVNARTDYNFGGKK